MSMFFNRLPWLKCFNGRRDSCEELLPLNENNGEPVILNVYDLFNVNEFGAARIGLGIFHTGIQVYDREYTYGGHNYSHSGIFEIMPRTAEIELGEHFHYRESIQLGYTQFGRDEVMRIVEQLGCQFTGNSYHLTSNNCNHFSDAMSRILCGQEIPKCINRLAYFIGCVPFLQRCLPTDWLTPM